MPKAYVVLAAGWNASPATAQLVLDHARQRLAAAKEIVFLEFLDDLPRTPSNKIHRDSLQQLPRSATMEFTRSDRLWARGETDEPMLFHRT